MAAKVFHIAKASYPLDVNAVKLRICTSRRDLVCDYRLLRFLKLLRMLRFLNVPIDANVIISFGEPEKPLNPEQPEKL